MRLPRVLLYLAPAVAFLAAPEADGAALRIPGLVEAQTSHREGGDEPAMQPVESGVVAAARLTGPAGGDGPAATIDAAAAAPPSGADDRVRARPEEVSGPALYTLLCTYRL